MKKYFFILLSLFILNTQVGANDEITELKDYLGNLQEKVDERWEKYRGWQANSEWVQNNVDMSLSGEIYNEGWFGPKTSRQIVPDMVNGWLVVDTVTVSASLLMSAATLAGNILVNQVFPYIQAGPIKEKTFVNVRAVKTYEEALLAEPFNVNKLPITAADFENLEVEEQISTQSTGGVFIRAGGGISSLIGLELPAHINIGPKSKVTFEGSLKLTVVKSADNHAMISVENISEMSNGLGFGFGVFFEDVVDIPVTIGINSSNGYFPFLFNMKDSVTKTKSVVYDLDLSTEEGQQAYEAFLSRDFSAIDDIADASPEAVVMDIRKEGVEDTHETNGMVNLIAWRSGFRNIFVEGSFNTTDRAGNRFEYFELESEQIKDRKWFSNIEKTSLKFSALVPSDKHENGEVIKHTGGFLLDTQFYYEDTKTKGEEINEVSDFLMDSGTQMRLPITVDKNQNYEQIQIEMNVRIQAENMGEFLNASERDIWFSVAYAQGINDHYLYESEESRKQFIKEGVQGSQSDRKKLVARAKKVVNHITDLAKLSTLKEKAKSMIKFLKKGKEGQLLHKTILEYIGKNKVMVKGYVRGKLI